VVMMMMVVVVVNKNWFTIIVMDDNDATDVNIGHYYSVDVSVSIVRTMFFWYNSILILHN